MQDQHHILIVDDDQAIRTLLRDYLQANGFDATAVAGGDAMFAELDHGRTDLVVLDLMLPGENGLDLCRRLRQTSDLPVIMLTALGDEVERIVGLEVGADDYVPKPFNPRELLGRIRAVLRPALPLPVRRQAGASRSGASISPDATCTARTAASRRSATPTSRHSHCCWRARRTWSTARRSSARCVVANSIRSTAASTCA